MSQPIAPLILSTNQDNKTTLDQIPSRTVFSAFVLGTVEPELISTLITIRADNGIAVYRVSDIAGTDRLVADLLMWQAN